MKTPSQIKEELSNNLVNFYSNAISSYTLLFDVLDFPISDDAMNKMSDEIAMTQRDFESLSEELPDSEFIALYDKTANTVVNILIPEILSFLKGYFSDDTSSLLNISLIEKKAGVPAKTLYFFINGERSLNEDHLNKLIPILNKLTL